MMSRNRAVRIVAAIALVAVTLGSARPADAAGELSVSVVILRGATATDDVRRNEAVTVKVTVTNNSGAAATLNSLTLTTTGLYNLTNPPTPTTPTLSPALPQALAIGEAKEFTFTGLKGALDQDELAVSIKADAAGTAGPDPIDGTVTKNAALLDFSVATELRRGAGSAAAYLVGDPVVVDTIITSNLPGVITLPGATGLVLTTSNVTGTPAAFTARDIPAGTFAMPEVTTIRTTGLFAGPSTAAPVTASSAVEGSVPNNTLDNGGGSGPEAVAGNSTANPDSAPVGSVAVTTHLARLASPGTAVTTSFFAGEQVVVRVTVTTTNLPAPLTVDAADVALTRSNLAGTGVPSAVTITVPATGSNTIDFTGFTAGPGSPATVFAVVEGTLPDNALTIDGNGTEDTVSATSATASVAVVTPTLTFGGVPVSGTNVDRGDTIIVTARFTNPADAPFPVVDGTITVVVPDRVLITAQSPDALVVGTTVTKLFPLIAAGATVELSVTTQVKGDATKVGGGADLSYSAAFASTSLAAPVDVPAPLTYEINPEADIQMQVNAPTTEARQPANAEVPVEYRVFNAGPDTGANISFVATAPPSGFIGSPSVSEGADWTCNGVPASDNISCTYDPGTLVKDATTAAVTITWKFNDTGDKVFTAKATTTTTDPTVTADPADGDGNNTATDTTTVVNPTSSVDIISATATPDPVTVAFDVPAQVTVDYVIKNTGNNDLSIRATLTAPAGATLDNLTGTDSATCTLLTAACDVVVDKNGDEVTITATYTVPQSSFTLNQASFSATIVALDGGTIDPGPTRTLSDFVVGQPPVIDIGLAAVADPVINLPFGTLVTVDPRPTVPVSFTFQNFSTDFEVRAGTASIEIELPAAPTPSIQPPRVGGVDCPQVGTSPVRYSCAIAGAVPVAPAGGSSTVTLDVVLPVANEVAFTITARAIVSDPGNRTVADNPATPDSRNFIIDVNRVPKANDEVGPSLPTGATLDFAPVGPGLLHEDTDNGDTLILAAAGPLTCPSAACVFTGGDATNLSYTITNSLLKVTFAGVATPTLPATEVTATITYLVSDGPAPKVPVSSSVKVRLLPAIRLEGDDRVAGSFGTPQSPAPRSFGFDVTAEQMGTTATAVEVLEGARGKDANNADFPDRTYDVLLPDAVVPPETTTLNVEKSPDSGLSVVTSTVVTGKKAVQYIPPRAYTSDPPVDTAIVPDTAPPDSFRFRTQGKKGLSSIYTADIPVTVFIRNQNPIGIDSPFDVPNGVTQTVFPATNDLDGNTIVDTITTKVPADDFLFDDEGDLEVPDAAARDKRRLKITCIGPMPAADQLSAFLTTDDPFAKCPANPGAQPATGWKRPGDALELSTADSKGKVTVTVAKDGVDAFRGVTASADATVVGDLDFVYVVVDNYGGASFAKATARVPNTPPQVIEGVRTVLKNTPTVVVDTRLAAQDANGDNIVVSGTSERTQHGTSKIGDNNRTITYTPDRDYLGADKLLYNVSDGRADGAASAELQLNVIEQPGAITDAGSTGSGAGGTGGAPGGNLAATGGDPLALTFAAGCSLVLGLALVHAGRRRQSLPLLERARHLRT